MAQSDIDKAVLKACEHGMCRALQVLLNLGGKAGEEALATAV